MKNDLDENGGLTAEQYRAMKAAYQKERLAAYESEQEANRRAAHEMVVSRTEWNSEAHEAETQRQLAEFNNYRAEQDKIERTKTEAANGLRLVTDNPRYIKSAANAQNITSWLREHHQEATPYNLQLAYNNLAAANLLELHPAPTALPPKVYSMEELYRMPMTSNGNEDVEWGLIEGPETLAKVCQDSAQQNAKLEGEDDQW